MSPRLPTDHPALETARLRMRAPLDSDVPGFRAILAIAEVTQYSDWPDGPTERQVARSMKWMREALPKGKGCAWMIEERASGTLIGAVRFNNIDTRGLWAEIGYELHPAFRGRGYMPEAVEAVATCGFGLFGLNRLEAWTLPGNPASDRVLEKAGFQYEGTLRQKAWFKGAFHDFRMFARLCGGPK